MCASSYLGLISGYHMKLRVLVAYGILMLIVAMWYTSSQFIGWVIIGRNRQLMVALGSGSNQIHAFKLNKCKIDNEW